MKHFKKFLLVLLIIPCIFMMNGCVEISHDLYVTDIVQTEIVGDTATYTVYYSNGTTSLFTVKNGKDGENGSGITMEFIEDYCSQHGVTVDSFLKQYLTVEVKTPTVLDAANKALLSAVTIWCEHTTEDYYHNKDVDFFCGSGVIYQMGETYSYVVTNYHVVYYSGASSADKIARKITLFQYGTSELVYTTNELDAQGFPKSEYGYGAVDAEYVGGSLNYDLAVLRVKTADLKKYNQYAQAVNIAADYEVGETAIAVGNPACEGFSVTSGIVSVLSERITMTGADDQTTCQFRVMRMDTSINGGNSGGGLFDIDGNLIGIVNAKVVSSEIDNIAYALPYDNVTAVVDNLIYYFEQTGNPSKVKKLVLGITTEAQNMHAEYNPETNRTVLKEDAVIVEMAAGIGRKMGLDLEDKILAISINGNEHTINKQYQIGDLLITVRPTDKILFKVERAGEVGYFAGIATEEGILESQLTEVK